MVELEEGALTASTAIGADERTVAEVSHSSQNEALQVLLEVKCYASLRPH
jgi:hypothetical protein